jgi:hypothetical protein
MGIEGFQPQNHLLSGSIISRRDVRDKRDERKGGRPMDNEKLGRELGASLGPGKAKEVLQDLALVIGKHGLVKEPEICEKLFRYMSFVVWGWNPEKRGQS